MIEPWATSTDPYTNEFNNKYIVVLGWTAWNIATPSTPGYNAATNAAVVDPNGNNVCLDMAVYQDYEVTGSLSDEAYAHTYMFRHGRRLLSPGYQLKDFSAAYGVICDTLGEASLFL